MEPQDTITIAPAVLIMIAQQAALDTEGVVRMGTIPVAMDRLLRGRLTADGVALDIEDNQVTVTLHLIVKPNASMREVGRAVQRAVTRAIQELVGMDVTAVNVHIEDVAFLPAEKAQD
jgi:uncharacterized alkaline shock family protein YloU